MSEYLPDSHDCSDHEGTAVVHCGRCRRAFFPDDKAQAIYKASRNRFDLPHYCDACQFEIDGIWEKQDDGPQGRLF